MEKDLEMARRMAGTAAERGGRVYFVGGFVRDGVMGRESKDVDIEIHGMTADAVRGMLGEIGPWKEMAQALACSACGGIRWTLRCPGAAAERARTRTSTPSWDGRKRRGGATSR